MAICHWCNREMLLNVSCTVERYVIVDGSYPRMRVRARRTEHNPQATCGDCGAPSGGYHHPGCDMERCPRCRRQAISCGCDGI